MSALGVCLSMLVVYLVLGYVYLFWIVEGLGLCCVCLRERVLVTCLPVASKFAFRARGSYGAGRGSGVPVDKLEGREF